MRTAADRVASADAGLDYSLDSLEIADQIVAGLGRGDVRLHQFGAYLGELLCRQRDALAWAFGGYKGRQPVVAVGRWCADPFARLDDASRGKQWLGGLREYASGILAFAAAPSDETAEGLGWHQKYIPTSNWRLDDRSRQRRRLRRLGEEARRT